MKQGQDFVRVESIKFCALQACLSARRPLNLFILLTQTRALYVTMCPYSVHYTHMYSIQVQSTPLLSLFFVPNAIVLRPLLSITIKK